MIRVRPSSVSPAFRLRGRSYRLRTPGLIGAPPSSPDTRVLECGIMLGMSRVLQLLLGACVVAASAPLTAYETGAEVHHRPVADAHEQGASKRADLLEVGSASRLRPARA